MSLIFQYDPTTPRKTSYSKTECLRNLEILLYQRDQIDTFGNRLRRFGASLLRLFFKNLWPQKLERPIPPRQWIVQMAGILDAVEGEDLSNTLRNSDAYKKVWQDASDLSLQVPYSGKIFCEFDLISFLSNIEDET